MSPKVIIRNTPPNFYELAARAAATFAKEETEHSSYILQYKDGPVFWLEWTKAGNISVSGENVKWRGGK